MAISMISMGKVRFESTGTFSPKIFRQTELRMGTTEEMKWTFLGFKTSTVRSVMPCGHRVQGHSAQPTASGAGREGVAVAPLFKSRDPHLAEKNRGICQEIQHHKIPRFYHLHPWHLELGQRSHHGVTRNTTLVHLIGTSAAVFNPSYTVGPPLDR